MQHCISRWKVHKSGSYGVSPDGTIATMFVSAAGVTNLAPIGFHPNGNTADVSFRTASVKTVALMIDGVLP